MVWIRLEKRQVAESLGCSREDRNIGHSLQSTVAELKGNFILFPVNFLGNCFVNNFYIYENVCFFFLLSKKLLVISFLAGHRHPESLVTALSVLSLHLDGHQTVCPFPCGVFSQTWETVFGCFFP